MESMSLPQISGTLVIPQKFAAISKSYSSHFIKVTSASSTITTKPTPKLRNLCVEDAKEADFAIAWAAYKRIEPQCSRTNQMLANM
jgi:hypothetical protein